MRIAAGIVLIIAALFNLFASLGYLAGGAATTGFAMVGDAVVQDEGVEMTAEEKEEFSEGAGMVAAAGGALMAFSAFLLVSVGVLIAGAVFLFQGTKPIFIFVAAGFAVLAELVAMLITAFGVTNLFGIVGGLLAILAAMQIRKTLAAGP